MTNDIRGTAGVLPNVSETAASAYHLSDTLVWESLSSQIKNHVIIVSKPAAEPQAATPDPSRAVPTVEPGK